MARSVHTMRAPRPPPSSIIFVKCQAPEVNLVMGDYYLDGPVLLKSGISLVGIVSEDSPFITALSVHGTGTGSDGVIVADGVSGALVSTIRPDIGGSKFFGLEDTAMLSLPGGTKFMWKLIVSTGEWLLYPHILYLAWYRLHHTCRHANDVSLMFRTPG